MCKESFLHPDNPIFKMASAKGPLPERVDPPCRGWAILSKLRWEKLTSVSFWELLCPVQVGYSENSSYHSSDPNEFLPLEVKHEFHPYFLHFLNVFLYPLFVNLSPVIRPPSWNLASNPSIYCHLGTERLTWHLCPRWNEPSLEMCSSSCIPCLGQWQRQTPMSQSRHLGDITDSSHSILSLLPTNPSQHIKQFWAHLFNISYSFRPLYCHGLSLRSY